MTRIAYSGRKRRPFIIQPYIAEAARQRKERLRDAAGQMAEAIRTAAKHAQVIQLGDSAGMVLLRREDYDALENALDAATGEYSA